MQNKTTRMIVEIAIMAALGLALDFVAGLYSAPFWSQGGSISIAMVAIFIVAYRKGLVPGLITAFLIGTIQILWGYAIGFGQVFLDYIFPYTILGLVGMFAGKVEKTKGFTKILWFTLPIIAVCLVRTFSHVLSGMIYFATPFWASLAYNGPFMAISTPICLVITIILYDRLKGVFE